MKKLIQMSSFMIILAVVTAGLISGMDKLTAKRIEENANFEWKSAILTHNEISHSVTDYVALFDQNFEAIDNVENPRDRVYRNKTTGTYNFYYTGGGVWGEINGVITLESDGKTIVTISVLNQSETPGLGALVATRDYLNKYVGKQFSDALSLVNTVENADPNAEVDAITGATGTSRRFIVILNDVYQAKMGGNQ